VRTHGIRSRGPERRPCTSCSRGTSRAAGSSQLLFIQYELVDHPHAGSLVEPGRTRRILGVDAESHMRVTATVELPERMSQQGQADAAASPRLSHTDRADPAAAVAVRLAAGDTRDLVALAHDEPQRHVRLRSFE